MRMGQIFSHPLSLTLLLALVPLSQSWGLFQNQQTQPPSSGAADSSQTLADAAIDSFKNGADNSGASSANSPPRSNGNSFSERILPAYEEMPELMPLWNLFSLPTFLTESVPSLLKAIIFYKPPVGITSVYVFLNLVLSRNQKLVRSFFILDELDDGSSQPMKRRSKRKIGRRLDLDDADGKLKLGMGGVEAVRAELCLAALGGDEDGDINFNANGDKTKPPPPPPPPRITSFPTSDPRYQLSDLVTRLKYAAAVKDALRTNASPRSAREDYIESTLEPLSRLAGLFDAYKNFDDKFYLRHNSGKHNAQSGDDDNGVDILWMSAKVAEVRTLDALLRVLRERLLISAVRLSKKEKYRAWRLQWYENGFARLGKRYLRKMIRGKTLENDRVSLQLTSAALKREMERLGQVQMLLLNRPTELSETRLLMATFSDMDDGSLRKGRLDSVGAKLALQSSYRSRNPNGNLGLRTDTENSIHKYTVESHNWTVKSRALVNELVSETLKAAFHPNDKVSSDKNTTVAHDLQTLSEWANYNKCDLEGWHSALTLIENLSKARLMREQKFLPSATDLKYMLRQFDVYGIPSSLATVGGALMIHNIVQPYWPDIIKSAKFLSEAVWGVIEFRFWTPAKDIILDLLNRRESLMDPYSLANEEMSLDNMLRDLGIGDGTPANRPQAVADASRMYEKELAQGAIKNIFRGDMVRLLLIQVQQLKTGSLLAMGSIDELMDSNRLNLQLLATIPAFLLVTFGTRIFFRAMFSFRSRELIVGFGDAKAEMGNLLRKMERCLLLASHKEDVFEAPGDSKDIARRDFADATSSAPVILQPNELGEFVLHMHSYLTILDYCSPPFPTKGCDDIHSGMQDLLLQGQLSTKRQIALLQVSLP